MDGGRRGRKGNSIRRAVATTNAANEIIGAGCPGAYQRASLSRYNFRRRQHLFCFTNSSRIWDLRTRRFNFAGPDSRFLEASSSNIMAWTYISEVVGDMQARTAEEKPLTLYLGCI